MTVQTDVKWGIVGWGGKSEIIIVPLLQHPLEQNILDTLILLPISINLDQLL